VGVIVLQCTPPLASVFDDLRISIKLRKEMHAMHTRKFDSEANKDNASHAHYISVLEDSYKRLRAIAVDTTSGAVHTEGSSLNAFDSLSMDEPEMPPEGGLDVRISVDLTHTEVRIRGLSSKTRLNGQLAYAAQYNEDTGRYTVWCAGEGMAIKPENLERCDAAAMQDLLGESAAIEAACLLLDLEGVVASIGEAWRDFKGKHITLLGATAVTHTYTYAYSHTHTHTHTYTNTHIHTHAHTHTYTHTHRLRTPAIRTRSA
jgi:hypothetical protein